MTRRAAEGPRSLRVGLVLTVALAPASCDLPTSAPVLETKWLFEVRSTTIDVDGLLPTGVTRDAGAFSVAVDPGQAGQGLDELCPLCLELQGRSAPKPAFTGGVADTLDLPASVVSADLATGSVELSFHHDFDFDPLRPPGGQAGSFTVTVSEIGGRELARAVLDGAADSLPPGEPYRRTLALAPGTVGPQVVVAVSIASPAGGRDREHWVRFAADQSIRASVAPAGLSVSSAVVDVVGRQTEIEPAAADVEGVDGAIVDRIATGAFVLEIANPFGVGLDAEFVIVQGDSAVVRKDFQVSQDATSTESIPLSAEEFRSFLGKADVVLGGSATVVSPTGGVRVAPDMEVKIDGNVELVIRAGS